MMRCSSAFLCLHLCESVLFVFFYMSMCPFYPLLPPPILSSPLLSSPLSSPLLSPPPTLWALLCLWFMIMLYWYEVRLELSVSAKPPGSHYSSTDPGPAPGKHRAWKHLADERSLPFRGIKDKARGVVCHCLCFHYLCL